MELSRRTFLESATLASLAREATAAVNDPKTGMPMRTLGKTGAKVSVLGFGAGIALADVQGSGEGPRGAGQALKAGINYVDSAASYGDGQSERWIGEYLKTHKKDFFLVTKIAPRKRRRCDADLSSGR